MVARASPGWLSLVVIRPAQASPPAARPPGLGPGYGAVPPPAERPAPPGQPSSRAIVALVMAAVSWVLCPCVCAVPALLLSRAELSAIDRGESDPEGRRLTQVALWLSVGNCVVYGLFSLAYVFIYSVGFVAR